MVKTDFSLGVLGAVSMGLVGSGTCPGTVCGVFLGCAGHFRGRGVMWACRLMWGSVGHPV